MSPSLAVQIPPSCGGDARIRCVPYNPNEVVAITAVFGLQTFILFEEDEELLDLGGGDTGGWEIGVLTKKNGLFIKPKARKPATNITFVTNKRYYNFDFFVAKLKNTEERNYMTRFIYPEAQAEELNEISTKEKIDKLLSYASTSKPKNDDYWVEGSDEFTPTAAWDDGETTYFRFSPNTDLPAVYSVGADGTETLLNKNFPEPYTMAVQMVGRKFIFRKGIVFTCIYNESYDKYGIENQSRTSSPSVKRVLKEEVREDLDKKGSLQKTTTRITPGAMPLHPNIPVSPAPGGLPTFNLNSGR